VRRRGGRAAAQVLLDPSGSADAVLTNGATALRRVPVSVEYTSWTTLVPAVAEIGAGIALASP
jgi:hypothetical protein